MQEISEYCHHGGTIKSTAMIAEVGQKTGGGLSSVMTLVPNKAVAGCVICVL